MKTSTAVWLGIGGVVLVGGVLYFVLKPKPKKEEEDKKEDKKEDEVIKNPSEIKLIQNVTNTTSASVLDLVSKLRQYEVTNTDGANVRKEPNTKSDIVKKFNKGDKFLGVDNGKGWIQLTKSQFVSKNLTKVLPVPAKKQNQGVAAVK